MPYILDLKAGHLVVKKPDGTGRTIKSTEQLGPLPATHWGLVDNFVSHQLDRTPLACDGMEGRKSTVIIDIINDIRPNGEAVTVDYGIPSS